MNADEQPPRKPANENSWYCLATLYGECTEGCDQNLHTRNRAAWNRWMAGELEDDKREELATLGFERSELIPLAGSELREFLAYFKSRTSLPLPEFKGIIDFSGVYFDHPLFFSQFVFPGFVKLNACQFDKFVHLHGCYMVGLDLTDAVFEEIFLCDAAIIRGTVSFMGAKFKKWCSAERLKFVSLANFSSIKCHDGFRLDSSVFETDGVVTFDRAWFNGPASFRNVSFPISSFNNTVFCNNVFFGGSVFNDTVSFDGAEFSAEV